MANFDINELFLKNLKEKANVILICKNSKKLERLQKRIATCKLASEQECKFFNDFDTTYLTPAVTIILTVYITNKVYTLVLY